MTSHYHCTAQSAAGSLAMAISSAMALEVRLALENLDHEFGMEIMPSGRLWKANDFGDWWLMQLIFIQFIKLTSVGVGSRFIALYIKSNTFVLWAKKARKFKSMCCKYDRLAKKFFWNIVDFRGCTGCWTSYTKEWTSNISLVMFGHTRWAKLEMFYLKDRMNTHSVRSKWDMAMI